MHHTNEQTRVRWQISCENEFGRLFQGFPPNDIEGIGVLEWIHRSDVPPDKKVTYPRYTVDIRPEKDEIHRTRITCGGDRLDYDGDVTAHTASMETIKCHWNSVLSTPNARYATGDISNMYLMSLLPNAEYVRFKWDMIPPRIREHYKLHTLVQSEYVYAKINRAWYGLKQAGKIAHDDLVSHLEQHGYIKAKWTEGLFFHRSRDISFTLVVDDFGIKYTDPKDLQHLATIMRIKYPFKIDEQAKQYIGITLNWDYEQRELRCSMPGYVQQALKEFEHLPPKQHFTSPSRMPPRTYNQPIQQVYDDDAPPLNQSQQKYIQQVVGKFLYYARAIDNTMLHAMNDIASAMAKGTETTLRAVKHFLNYAASNPDAEIIYRASDMILRLDSDAAYLVCPQARSRAGGYHYLTNTDGTLFNGPIFILAKIIKNVMASAAEAEIAGIFLNAQEAIPIRRTLIELGHPQPPTAITTDNSTANGIINGEFKQKRSKAIDMRFHWIKNRIDQNQLQLTWAPGSTNLGDYPTKHHTGTHHRRVRPIYLHVPTKSPTTLQGCVRLLAP